MKMKIKKWIENIVSLDVYRQFSVKLGFKLQDFFIGFYWKTQKNIYGFNHLDLWILIIPTLPIHIHCLIGKERETIPKITELYYDSTGRAYPPMSDSKINWEKTYEYNGKYYKITGDENHKEWSEIQKPLPTKKRGIKSVNLKKEKL